jgi:hypothetical protein
MSSSMRPTSATSTWYSKSMSMLSNDWCSAYSKLSTDTNTGRSLK